MPTIKTKKEMNLPELIEWGSKNEVVSKEYRCNEDESKSVIFSISGSIYFTNFKPYSIRDTFTIEEKIEITEDTKLDYIYLITNNTNYSEGYYNYSINDILSNNEGFYQELAMLNMNPEPTIIWTKEKGLVE